RPDHVPQGELQHYRPQGRFPNKTVSAPEFQIMTSVAANNLANTLRNDVLDAELDSAVRQYDASTGSTASVPLKIRLDFSEEILLAQDDPDPTDDVVTGPDALLQHLNVLMCHGSLSDAARTDLAGIIEAATTSAEVRAEGAILALLTAPDCAVHE
ncbi:MAG: hypothetical protein ABFS23_12820, partial [Pseudomonadota bacterium]